MHEANSHRRESLLAQAPERSPGTIDIQRLQDPNDLPAFCSHEGRIIRVKHGCCVGIQLVVLYCYPLVDFEDRVEEHPGLADVQVKQFGP